MRVDITIKQMDIKNKNIFIVCYDASPYFITSNRKEAESKLKEKQKEWPLLGWRLFESISEFGDFCYEKGRDAGYR